MATSKKSAAKKTPARKRIAKRVPAAPSTGATPAAKAAGPAAPSAVPAKVKKPKLVRDSFTIPKPEYAVLDQLKLRAAKAGLPAKKSEILRGGVKALAAMSDAAFLAAMRAVPSIKTGRPARQ